MSARLPRVAAARGFTLVELSVALAAGLLVAMAVVGLSKEATNTFHEEVRAASAEMSLRGAIDRVRSDLSRASYMSTPNIFDDPTMVSTYNPKAQTGVNLQHLAGIRLFDSGSASSANIANGTLAGTDDGSVKYSGNNGLAPDAIDISGNLNSVDTYTVQTTDTSACGTTGNSVRLVLSTTNPPAYRLAAALPATTGPLAALQRAFLPVSGQTFIVRLQDLQGRVQYLPICGVGYTNNSPAQPYLDIASLPIQTGSGVIGGVSGFYTGATVSPVLTVRYQVAPTQALYSDLNPTGDLAKFDLYRSYVDVNELTVGNPELIAEYVVDLKFAFTVDNTGPSGPPQTATRTQATYPFGDPNNVLWGGEITGVTTTIPTAGAPGPVPQRIRSVRVRLATRAPTPDRTALISPPSAFTPADYLYRYCTTGVSPSTCTSFARVRTVVTEVNLNNQAGALYP